MAYGQRYADQVTANMGTMNALYPPLADAHRQLAPEAIDLVRAVGTALGAAHRELTAAARMYDDTDRDQAEKLDKQYLPVFRYDSPKGMRPAAPSQEQASERKPLDRIRGEPTIKVDPTESINNVFDHITSRAHNLNGIIHWITGVGVGGQRLPRQLVGRPRGRRRLRPLPPLRAGGQRHQEAVRGRQRPLQLRRRVREERRRHPRRPGQVPGRRSRPTSTRPTTIRGEMNEYLRSVVERITDGLDDEHFTTEYAVARLLDAIEAETEASSPHAR